MVKTGRYHLNQTRKVNMTSNEINHFVDAVRILVTSVTVQSEVHHLGLIWRKQYTNPNWGTNLQNGL